MANTLEPMQLYVIATMNVDNVKVGISNNPMRRLEEFQVVSKLQLHLVYASDKYEFGKARTIELIAHRVLAKFRIKNEWFKIRSDIAINAVKFAVTTVNEGKEKEYLAKNEHSRLVALLVPHEREMFMKISHHIQCKLMRRCSVSETIRIVLNEYAAQNNID